MYTQCIHLNTHVFIFQTTYATSFALYHLATNPECQEKLYSEACYLIGLPNRSHKATTLDFNQTTYTKAVIKEMFRMNPVSVGVGRILAKNTVLAGYEVPAGVSILEKKSKILQVHDYKFLIGFVISQSQNFVIANIH